MAVRLAVERLNALKEKFQLFQGKLDFKTLEDWENTLHIQQSIPEKTSLSLLINELEKPKIVL